MHTDQSTPSFPHPATRAEGALGASAAYGATLAGSLLPLLAVAAVVATSLAAIILMPLMILFSDRTR